MNRKERRTEARRHVKGRDARRSAARALKQIEIASGPLEEQDPFPNLREAGVVVAEPRRLIVPGQEGSR